MKTRLFGKGYFTGTGGKKRKGGDDQHQDGCIQLQCASLGDLKEQVGDRKSMWLLKVENELKMKEPIKLIIT